jgi:hypothetical protein
MRVARGRRGASGREGASPSLTPTENLFEKKEGETGKQYTYFRYYSISGSCFPAGISRREGFYAPPASHAIPVNREGETDKSRWTGEIRAFLGSAVAPLRTASNPSLRRTAPQFPLERHFCRRERACPRPRTCLSVCTSKKTRVEPS